MTYIAEKGAGPFRHRFGGTTWSVAGPEGASPGPALILTLDCRDPQLETLAFGGELPLCSRTDGESFERQVYRFDPASRSVEFSGRPWVSTLDAEDLTETPFPESSLLLRPSAGRERWSGGESWEAQDSFLGGTGFIRVLGAPLWLAGEERVGCGCGKGASFVAAVGYENYDAPSGLLPGSQPFFLGELALYFFVCFDCLVVEVVSQST